jgi:hypothetical protein
MSITRIKCRDFAPIGVYTNTARLSRINLAIHVSPDFALSMTISSIPARPIQPAPACSEPRSWFRSPSTSLRQLTAFGLLLIAIAAPGVAQPAGIGNARSTVAATNSLPATAPVSAPSSGLEFIDTSFENASPLWYELSPDGTILLNLLYDLERSSPNRAAGHIHFRIHAKPGSKLNFEIRTLDNVWNGVRSSIAKELKTVCISEDGRNWRVIPVDNSSGTSVRFTLEMSGPRLYVARIEPYRLSDLARFLDRVRADPKVEITTIGKTVQGRDLEIVRIGNPAAPYRIFIRARAHPWEPGGNWVVEGLVGRLLRDDSDARRYLSRTCYYVMPMANKDGVALGRTRFNVLGKDLNREWHRPIDGELAPENLALEQWLEGMIAQNRAPHLAMEFHNDGGGLLHISRPPVPKLPQHLARMALLEKLLRQHTWFTEGPTNTAFRNSGTLGDGWLQRYGVDAVVHELNANWIAGLNDYATGRHWMTYGENLAVVIDDYFGAREN